MDSPSSDKAAQAARAAPPPVAKPGAAPVAKNEPDAPGKMAEPAALSGAEHVVEDGMSPVGQGAQVVLTGAAQEAARGGTHSEIAHNTVARNQAIADGHVVEGTTAQAAADAGSGAVIDEFSDAEDEAIAKVRADFAAKRAARVKSQPRSRR